MVDEFTLSYILKASPFFLFIMACNYSYILLPILTMLTCIDYNMRKEDREIKKEISKRSYRILEGTQEYNKLYREIEKERKERKE